MSKRVLVTGAAGFIGSHLVEELVSQGYRVRAFVRYNGRDDRGHLDGLDPEIQSEIEIFRGDLKDLSAVHRAVESHEWVFHLGALIAIPYSYQNPLDVIQTNVDGTAHILQACLACPCLDRLVLTSTSEVYGTAQRIPITEDHPLRGQSPYAATKIAADALGLSYHRSFDLPVTILRPFNTYGPRQSARAIIPTVISQALERDEIVVGNIETRRDLTFVRDTVSGFLAIAQSDEALGQPVNIGQGWDLSIGDLIQRIGDRLGKDLRIRSDPQRIRPQSSEVGRLVAGTERAQAYWGWQPQYDLDAGLDETIAWIANNSNRFRTHEYTT